MSPRTLFDVGFVVSVDNSNITKTTTTNTMASHEHHQYGLKQLHNRAKPTYDFHDDDDDSIQITEKKSEFT